MTQPIPVARLVSIAVDDSPDYSETVAGYCGGTYDETTQILTLTFEREDRDDADEDDDWSSAEYRFQLLPTPAAT